MSSASHDDEGCGRPPRWRNALSRMNVGHWTLVAVFAFFVYGWISVTAANDPYVFQIPYRLLAGWWRYMREVLPEVAVGRGMITLSLISLLVAMTALHFVLRWVLARMEGASAWTLKSTLAVTSIVLVLAASAIAGTSIGHQMAWIGRGQTTEDTSWSNGSRMRFYASKLAYHVFDYADMNNGQFPPILNQRAGMVKDSFSRKQLNGFLAHPNAEPEAWTYLGVGMNDKMPAHLPLIVSPRPIHPRPMNSAAKYLVVTASGDAGFVEPADYHKLMEEWREEMRKKEEKTPAK